MRYLGPQDAGDEDAGDPFANLPDPVPGKTANIGVLRGTIYYRPPGGSNKVTAAGSNSLVKLTGAVQIPMGSTIDAKRGTLLMETAVGISKPGQTQTATFNGGQFAVRSRGSTRLPMTELVMNERLTCQQNTRGKELTTARRSRRLWGNGKGRYRTRGRNSSATVRGTIWLTKDSCNGTTTVVRQGTVVVRDFKKRKNVTVKAPKRYTARAR
jgi:hypothetical protein